MKINILNFFKKSGKKNLYFLGGALLIFVVVRFVACNPNPEIAFYHWKSKMELDADQEKILLKNPRQPLYLHILDLVWDEEQQLAVPMAQVKVEKPLPESLPIIPVIFITNEVFEKTPADKIDLIIDRLVDRIESKVSNMPGQPIVQGIQIDCDWTVSTKEKYFTFLYNLNSKFSAPLSATIRLHQVKYADRTGVPPVSRGMLMFYNMGDLESPATQNSILDLNTAATYMQNFDQYPLPLDVALPLFDWGVVKRDGKVINLINALKKEDLTDSLQYNPIGAQTYQVTDSHYLKSFYCYEGDEIRLESVSPEQLEAAVTLLSKNLSKSPKTVCFYHLDQDIMQRYKVDFLEQLVQKFK